LIGSLTQTTIHRRQDGQKTAPFTQFRESHPSEKPQIVTADQTQATFLRFQTGREQTLKAAPDRRLKFRNQDKKPTFALFSEVI